MGGKYTCYVVAKVLHNVLYYDLCYDLMTFV